MTQESPTPTPPSGEPSTGVLYPMNTHPSWDQLFSSILALDRITSPRLSRRYLSWQTSEVKGYSKNLKNKWFYCEVTIEIVMDKHKKCRISMMMTVLLLAVFILSASLMIYFYLKPQVISFNFNRVKLENQSWIFASSNISPWVSVIDFLNKRFLLILDVSLMKALGVNIK